MMSFRPFGKVDRIYLLNGTAQSTKTALSEKLQRTQTTDLLTYLYILQLDWCNHHHMRTIASWKYNTTIALFGSKTKTQDPYQIVQTTQIFLKIQYYYIEMSNGDLLQAGWLSAKQLKHCAIGALAIEHYSPVILQDNLKQNNKHEQKNIKHRQKLAHAEKQQIFCLKLII